MLAFFVLILVPVPDLPVLILLRAGKRERDDRAQVTASLIFPLSNPNLRATE